MGRRFIYNNHNVVQAPTAITDYDGNVYTEIKIGSQTWLKQPLRTTKNRAGGSITCYNPGNDANNVTVFGKLYTFDSLTGTSNDSLAPIGYHVASRAEWQTLLSGYTRTTSAGYHYLLAGTKLKYTGTTAWTNANGTDDYGFSQPGAGYYYAGSYSSIKTYNWTWCTTPLGATGAYIFQFGNTSTEVYEPDGGNGKVGWFFGGVRMLKD